LKNVAGTSTPTDLGLSPDGRTLYVTLGDLNAVAVLDVNGEALALKGYIPTGWYPSSVVAPSSTAALKTTGRRGEHDFQLSCRAPATSVPVSLVSLMGRVSRKNGITGISKTVVPC
jgi:YVTN family beta-propeller protein